ncbi:DUF7446 family protein [Methylobacterium sp. CM6244]
MKRRLRIGHSPLSGRIYIGSVGKDENLWLSDKTDVTTEALLAVARHIGPGFVTTLAHNDGGPFIEIEVREVPVKEAGHGE